MKLKSFIKKLNEDKDLIVAGCGTKRTKQTKIGLELEKNEKVA